MSRPGTGISGRFHFLEKVMEKALLFASLIGTAYLFFQAVRAGLKLIFVTLPRSSRVAWNTVRLPNGEKLKPATVFAGPQAVLLTTGVTDWSTYDTPAFLRRGMAPPRLEAAKKAPAFPEPPKPKRKRRAKVVLDDEAPLMQSDPTEEPAPTVLMQESNFELVA